MQHYLPYKEHLLAILSPISGTFTSNIISHIRNIYMQHYLTYQEHLHATLSHI